MTIMDTLETLASTEFKNGHILERNGCDYATASAISVMLMLQKNKVATFPEGKARPCRHGTNCTHMTAFHTALILNNKTELREPLLTGCRFLHTEKDIEENFREITTILRDKELANRLREMFSKFLELKNYAIYNESITYFNVERKLFTYEEYPQVLGTALFIENENPRSRNNGTSSKALSSGNNGSGAREYEQRPGHSSGSKSNTHTNTRGTQPPMVVLGGVSSSSTKRAWVSPENTLSFVKPAHGKGTSGSGAGAGAAKTATGPVDKTLEILHREREQTRRENEELAKKVAELQLSIDRTRQYRIEKEEIVKEKQRLAEISKTVEELSKVAAEEKRLLKQLDNEKEAKDTKEVAKKKNHSPTTATPSVPSVPCNTTHPPVLLSKNAQKKARRLAKELKKQEESAADGAAPAAKSGEEHEHEDEENDEEEHQESEQDTSNSGSSPVTGDEKKEEE
jgi:hypothetical protein